MLGSSVPGASLQTPKALVLLCRHGFARAAPARPEQAPSPRGRSVGGVGGRPAWRSTGSDPRHFTRRYGERHPGWLDSMALRGAMAEGRPRPVRSLEVGALPFERSRRRQRVSLGRQGGERRRRAPSKPRTRSCDTHVYARTGDTSFTRSKDPCSSIVTYSPGEIRRRWRGGRGIAVGQTRASGRNRHRGLVRRTKRGSPRVPAPARARRGA